jgi:MauM/NapG family ferredoxin protein
MPVSPGPWSAYSTEPVYVRPPGAQPESQFVGQCCRSQQCVNVCPVQAIKIDYSGIFMNGNPYIDIDSQPCVMCQDILCTRNCPSGALQFTEAAAVKLGTAIWNESLCKRTTGDDCQLCVDKCPLGKTAIELDERRVVVHDGGCTGCGVCQHACPTWPKAVKVCPRDETPGYSS